MRVSVWLKPKPDPSRAAHRRVALPILHPTDGHVRPDHASVGRYSEADPAERARVHLERDATVVVLPEHVVLLVRK